MVAASIACGGTSGPSDGPSDILAPGQVVEGTLIAQRHLSVRSTTTVEVAVFAQAEDVGYSLSSSGSGGDQSIDVVPGNISANNWRQRTERHIVDAAHPLSLVLTPNAPGARFSLRVYRVNRAPEVLPQAITLGDTLVGETLENSADVDEFLVTIPGIQDASFFIQALTAPVTLKLTARIVGPYGTVRAPVDPNPAHLLYHRTPNLGLHPPDVFIAEVSMDAADPSAAYRLFAYPVKRGPERVAPTLSLGDTLLLEDLENPADVDSFSVDLAGDVEIIGYISAPPGIATLQFHVRGAQPKVYAARSEPASAELQSAATGRFYLLLPGGYYVLVGRDTTSTQGNLGTPLPYRVQFRTINRAPETLSPIVTPGDTLEGEAIDYVGDIDEFVSTVPGQFNAFIQALPAASADTLILTADVFGGPIGKPVASAGGDSALAMQQTGSFYAYAPVRLRIMGQRDTGGLHRGGYRAFLYPINRAPESAPATLIVGDSVSEAIEYPGDIDDFTLLPAPGDAMALRLTRAGNAPGALRGALAGGPPIQAVDCPDSGTVGGTTCWFPRLANPVMPVLATVNSTPGSQPGFRGPYVLRSWAMSDAPELGPAGVTIGTAQNEAIDPVGDHDVFDLDYRMGEWLSATVDQFEMRVYDSAWGYMALRSLEGRSTGRFQLPVSGRYKLRVTHEPLDQVTASGPYQIAVTRYPVTPETENRVLALEDSITAESLDQLGDLDEFMLQAPAGAEVQVLVKRPLTVPVTLLLPGDSVPFRFGPYGATGRFLMPAGGLLRILVAEDRAFAGGGHDSTTFVLSGAYHLVARAVHRPPEQASANLTIGQLVTTEWIDYEGEVDEFYFAGTQGQLIVGDIATPRGIGNYDIQLEIIDVATGQTLGAVTTDGPLATTAQIVLPADGQYMARVMGVWDEGGYGPFELQVR